MKHIVLFVMTLMSFHLMAQQVHVSGTVTDSKDKMGVVGASVLVKGTKTGTSADFDGNYTITAPSNDAILVFSSVGYKPLEVKVNGRNQINVVLEEDTAQLDEVVIIGYGTQKKRDLSGAVTQIKSEDILRGNPTDLSQGIQGKMAGVNISQNDGAPGAGVSINIRGTNSFSTSSQPLYIVDGIPFDAGDTPTSDANKNNNQTSNPLNFINPHDIESIAVLKDASATAIYGSRGANGVVLITTKRGKSGAEKVEFSATVTVSNVSKKMAILNAYDYANYVNEGTLNSYKYSGKPYTTLPYPEVGHWEYTNVNGQINTTSGQYYPSPTDFLNPRVVNDEYGNTYSIADTNWQDVIFQSGVSQEYNISVTGGSDKGWHSFSGNYLDQQGTIKGSGFTRYSMRVNIGRKVNSWLEMGMNTSYTNTDTDFTKSNSYDYGIIRSALLFPPTYDPYTEATTSDELNWLAANPYQYVISAYDNLKSQNIFNASYAEIKLFPFLKFRQNLGVGYTSNRRMTYYGRHTQEGRDPTNGKGGQSDNWYQTLTAESLLTFDKAWGVHSINAVAGFTYEKATWGSKSMSATNFPNDITGAFDMSQGLNKGDLASDYGESALVSFLARVNYSLMNKYLFTASYRRDGSSKFTQKNKWANFLSFAVAWRLSEEEWIKNLNVFSNLKLRASYGQTGNQGIGSYRTLAQLKSSNYPFGGSLSSGVSEVEWRGPVSEDLRWETTSQVDLGLDMGFLQNRINLTVDYYHKKTVDLLQEVKIPNSTGFTSMMINSGNVTNEGLEISGDFYILKNTPVKWNMNANISFNRNTIGGLEADQYAQRLWYSADNIFIQRNGCPIGAIFGYVEDGFYDNEAEVRANPLYTNASDAVVKAMIGEIKYRNFDDDPAITEADRVIIGNTNPDFTYGMTNSFEYKGFNLNFFIQGSYGNDIFNGNLIDVKMANIGNIPQFAYDGRWTEDNSENATWPKAISGYDRNMLLSNRYVEDGSYLRLKSLTIGYNWKPKFNGISNVNFSLTGTNLFTITSYSWFDPDVNAFGSDSSRRGVDIYSYPSSRTFSFGIKVDF
ncbi:MAG: TonB-dependent receptor [Flavobacteriales bacterium]|nr:TonB-dependent receptor [Flavobacteriales bacterium]